VVIFSLLSLAHNVEDKPMRGLHSLGVMPLSHKGLWQAAHYGSRLALDGDVLFIR
jgi:hypothetical protein